MSAERTMTLKAWTLSKCFDTPTIIAVRLRGTKVQRSWLPINFWKLDVDLLIPAALGDVITEKNAEHIQAEIIIEAANGPVSPEADEILEKKNVLILPDILANAGGVTVSYFEWVQNRQHYRWSLDRVRQELDRTMSDAFENVWQQAQQAKVSLRTAAFMIALTRVAKATELAGIG